MSTTNADSWDTAISQNATDETKRELASLAKTMADIRDVVQRDASRSTEVDFAKFKQQLTNSPEIVEMFQKAYSTLKLPKYESSEIQDVQKAFKVLEEEAKKQAAESAKRIEELEKELVLLKEERVVLSDAISYTTTQRERERSAIPRAKSARKRVSVVARRRSFVERDQRTPPKSAVFVRSLPPFVARSQRKRDM